jgi:hypothetical protein
MDYIGGWLAWLGCQVTSFLAWCPDNTQEVLSWREMFSTREPFGTIQELIDTITSINDLILSYSFDTGLDGMTDTPDYSMFTEPQIPDAEDIFDFNLTGNNYSTECSASIASIGNPEISQGMCFFFNFLRDFHIMPWFQLFVNLISLIILGLYGKKFKDQLAI